ncbi:hypothetical protein EOM81_11005 [bacterium]|nr:hypothetical protein [bacterium]
MSKTPRTLSDPKSYTDLEYAVMYKSMCEKLETDLADARAEIERLRRFERYLKEEFLMNTQNYPKEYHYLFRKKFKTALLAAERGE